jgi:6-pyruvoyltetrahydropterin/6-carboxytetrahydropterin synthase|tara:strand:+ start:2325 stop:2777 length:453 start_codon:yes stop_codon:yes gene_type:complete
MSSTIRRWIETDTGHRVPNHKSKCRNFHGHRYRWEAELEGEVVTEIGVSEEGMLIDFSDVSTILTKYIHDIVDHSFIVFEGDEEAITALSSMGDGHRTVIVPFIPTAENLARWAFEQVDRHISSSYGNKLRLHSFHVRETPKSWATWTRD